MPTARMSAALLLATFLFVAAPAPALAAPAAVPKADVVRTLERNARRLGRLRSSEPTFDAIRTGRTTIGVRAGRNIITVAHPFSRSGFFLDGRGRLSAADRRSLGELIARVAPNATSRSVTGTLRASIGKERAVQRQLRAADPTIDRLLGQVGKLAASARPNGPDEVLLWRKGRSSLSYRPQQKVIVSRQGLFGTGQGFFLDKGAAPGAPKLREDSRQDLRQFVNRHGVR